MKKKIPLGLRKILDDISKSSDNLFRVELGTNPLIKFSDIDSESDFFFEIKSINVKNSQGQISYTINYLPSNEETLDPLQTNVFLSAFRNHFNKWKNLLIESNKESPLFDDYFTQAYYEELEPKFEIIDEDAEYKPFSISQQKMITLFLDRAVEIIKENKI